MSDKSYCFIFNKKPAESWDNSFWRQNSSVLDITTISDGASSTDDTVLADIDVGVDHGGVDDATLADIDVIPDLERKEGNSFAKLFKRWPYDGLAGDDAVSSNPDISQIPSNNCL